MKIDLINAVWGRHYTEMFLEIGLPNQLTDGNLLAPGFRSSAVYKIYTLSENAATIRSHPQFLRLQKVLPVEILEMDRTFEELVCDIPDHANILKMNACHRLAIGAGAGSRSALVFLAPDFIMSEGALDHVFKTAESGKRALMCPAIRLARETFVPAFKSRFMNGEGAAPAPSRELVGVAMKHFNLFTKNLFYDSKCFYNHCPANIYWRVGAEGFLARGFHLHPLMIHPVDYEAMPEISIDGEYLEHCVPNLKDYHIPPDSDDMALFELSPAARFSSWPFDPRPSASWMANFINNNCLNTHRNFINTPIYYHSGGKDPGYSRMERKSRIFVHEVLLTARVFSLFRDETKRSPSQVLRAFARETLFSPKMTFKSKLETIPLLMRMVWDGITWPVTGTIWNIFRELTPVVVRPFKTTLWLLRHRKKTLAKIDDVRFMLYQVIKTQEEQGRKINELIKGARRLQSGEKRKDHGPEVNGEDGDAEEHQPTSSISNKL